MRKLILLLLLSVLLLANQRLAFGVSAYPLPVEIVQPDGSKITIIPKGDEHLKWAQTVDGYSLMRNSQGIFEYAKLDAGNNMVPSGVQARNETERSNLDNLFLGQIAKGLI